MDHDLRALERAHAAAPSDEAARDRLRRGRLRAGLGWHGERMPDGLRPGRHFPVYEWARERYSVELVLIPGGRIPCAACGGTGSLRALDWAGRPHDLFPCQNCGGAGTVSVAPYYLGRFPVLIRELLQFRADVCDGEGRHPEASTYRRYGRTVRPGHDEMLCAARLVAPDEMLQFCAWPGRPDAELMRLRSWGGLRLPTLVEWTRAATRSGGRFPWGSGPLIAARAACADPTFRVAQGPRGADFTVVAAEALNPGDLLEMDPSGAVRRIREGGPSAIGFARGVAAEGADVRVYPFGAGRGRPLAPCLEWPAGQGPRCPRCFSATTPTSPGAPLMGTWCPACAAHVEFAFAGSDRPLPARPAGATPDGAHDMIGNVWQVVLDEGLRAWRIVGCSVESYFGREFPPNFWGATISRTDPRSPYERGYEDVGFRVALNAVPQQEGGP